MRGGSNGGAAGEPDGSELLRAIDTGLGPELLERALTHRSYAYENGGLPTRQPTRGWMIFWSETAREHSWQRLLYTWRWATSGPQSRPFWKVAIPNALAIVPE